jgi:hypothetical protein
MNNPEIERVAETHYFIRPVLQQALKNNVLTSDGKNIFPDCSTYEDVWRKRFSDKFFGSSRFRGVDTRYSIINKRIITP